MLHIYKTSPNVRTPTYSTAESACFDISAYFGYMTAIKAYTTTNEKVEMLAISGSSGDLPYLDIPPEWRCMIPTGLIFDTPKGHCVKIYPRSGLSTKMGLNLINSVGIVDSDYVDPVYIPVFNNSQQRVRIYAGDRIAQGELVVVSQTQIELLDTPPLRKTDRMGGFGSTGISN